MPFKNFFKRRTAKPYKYNYNHKNDFFIQIYLSDNETVQDLTMTQEQTCQECIATISRTLNLPPEDEEFFCLATFFDVAFVKPVEVGQGRCRTF